MRSHFFFDRAAIVAAGCIASLVLSVVDAGATDCTITFRLDTNVTLAAMVVSVDYSEPAGEWPLVDLMFGSSCEPLDEWITIGTADDFSKTFTIVYQTSSPKTLDEPANFAACAYRRTGSAPSTSDFEITVAQAYEPGGMPASSLPTVSIADIACEGGGSTTTTTIFPTTTTTLVPGGACGDPVDPPAVVGSLPAVVNATDALFTLRTAVALESCELCVCDLDDSGGVTVSDALALLLIAVGQPGNLDCPPCSN